MSYIGNTPITQGFTPAVDYFSGNGSTTAFTLSRPVASVSQVFVVVNNVDQNPSTAYTVSNNTLTFTGAPSAGTNNIYVRYTSPITQIQGLTQSPSVLGPMSVSINGATGLGGTTNPIVNMSGAANNYVQAYVNNTTNGANSSADLVAYPNNGADSSGWVDVGITGQTYSQAAYSVTGPNEAYVFCSAPSGSGTTGNLVIATDSTGTANSIQFYTGGFNQAKSAAKMVIDGATGNVGIGTSSPAAKLDVNKGSAGTLANFTDGIRANFQISTSGFVTTAGPTAGSTSLAFQSSNTEAMRIDASGNLLVGGTNQSNTGKTISYFNGSTLNGIVSYDTAGASGTTFFMCSTNGTNIGTIARVGATSGVVYNTTSDERLKSNIEDAAPVLDKLMDVKVRQYNWTEGNLHQDYGFVAQEIEPLLSGVVTKGKEDEDMWQMDYSRLTPHLVKAIQEQQALITQQAAALKTLTERITALEAK